MQAIKLEMIERNIKAKFLGIHEYYKDEMTKDINETRLVDDVKKINPSMVVMVICYSQILHLRFLLEGSGIFSEVRLNRDLCLQSKGQILTLTETQKKFLQTLSQPENIEKKLVRIEGQVGSGKTLIGIEAMKMKIAHYIRKYGWNTTERKDKLRALVIFGGFGDCAELKISVEKELLEDIGNQSSVEVYNLHIYKETLKKIVTNQQNYTKFRKTIMLIDECTTNRYNYYFAKDIDIDIDYIHCIKHKILGKTGFKTDKTVHSCKLLQCQRSSQEILDLTNYINSHTNAMSSHQQVVTVQSPEDSFRSKVPIWIEAETDQIFSSYAESELCSEEDVMLIYDKYFPDIEKLCSKMKWKYWNRNDVIGSEASVVIIYDHAYFRYESFTRAKHQLIIVTISSRYRSSSTLQLIGFGLRGIEIGEHNDRICSEYQKEVAKRFNVPPPLCSYKTNKKRIQKLMKKIVVENTTVK